ncbi:PKD domain-containing protein [Actinosynnema sp. NPDC059335]|uniref:PKD domain-containing protein n=1 Tax=Actinosynnema sp. NPDC059335 TaxID=3346804 RepID=UPI00366CDDE0
MHSSSRRGTRSTTLIALVVAVVVAAPGVAHAAPPANDDFDQAVAITALPFAADLALDEATSAADDPVCSTSDEGSVWFDYTATSDAVLEIDLAESGYGHVAVFTGTRGALARVPGTTCASSYSDPIRVQAAEGTTYHVMVVVDLWRDPLRLTVDAVAPPANDDFADATPISTVPATAETRLGAATVEPGEPRPGCETNPATTAWFRFTAPRTESITIDRTSYDDGTAFAVYTGDSLGALTEVLCERYDRRALAVTAGSTYHIQVSNAFARPGPTTLALAVAPPLNTYFGQSSADPSVLDTVTFTDQSYDGAGEPITRTEWDFGDGTTAAGRQVEHRFAADGDYVVRMTVTSRDGRTAAMARTVPVRTHDVRIASFTAPTRGRTGQTKSIEVTVGNTRAPEQATVTLYRGGPGGFTEVARATQYVPARPDRTVAFPFNYTFTPDDAAVGRVTFRAVVTLPSGVRDARTIDNEAVAPATTVLPGAGESVR